MATETGLIPIQKIENVILRIRDEKVILDADLARLYGVSTKALNQAVKRNMGRFPHDFMFQLSSDETQEVVTNCDHLKNLKFSSNLPYAFTEHGTIMAANVLNNDKAVSASVQIVRTFVKLRQILNSNAELSKKIEEIEKKYDKNFKIVFDAVRKLMAPPDVSKGKIGFMRKENKTK